jgi:hypothetical protein
MKSLRIVGLTAALAALAACGGATEENNVAADNVALETENLDLNATDLNVDTNVDINAVDGNVDTNATDTNATENTTNAY